MLRKYHSNIEKRIGRKYFILLCVIVVLVLLIILFRVISGWKLRRETDAVAIPTVSTIKAAAGPAQEDIILPGNVQAWHEAPIYARTNGYIKKWYVDIGSRVKAGQLLAEIETPELDAQLRQAEANLKTVEANYALALSTAKRWTALLKTDSVSKQETDEKNSTALATQAMLIAAQANRDRLNELVGFEKVTAPFDGVITSRNTDIGSLINAGSNTSARALFHIAQSNPLRVYVKVPQNYSGDIRPAMIVTLTFAEHPGKTYSAKLLQTANAIDPVSRTLLVQFVANNSNNELLPGGYVEVHFKLPVPTQIIRLPVNTLLFRAEGLQVATIDKNDHVVLKKITITRDFGDSVEISAGLFAGEEVILNPPDSLFGGEKVAIKPAAPSAKGKATS